MVSGPVTSVARVEDVQNFLKDPVLLHLKRVHDAIVRTRRAVLILYVHCLCCFLKYDTAM